MRVIVRHGFEARERGVCGTPESSEAQTKSAAQLSAASRYFGYHVTRKLTPNRDNPQGPPPSPPTPLDSCAMFQLVVTFL